MKPIVAIVGRPNVGKSTIFNRLVGQRKSIVDDAPGVTRDRLYEEASWQSHDFILIDTGGIQWEKEDINKNITKQATIAIEEADVILFVADAQVGPTLEDQKIARILKRSGKPVILAINKTDNFRNSRAYDFYSLGLGEPIPVSATHGGNMGDLLDAVTASFPAPVEEEESDETTRIAVIGRPNVGKSSLINKLTGEERVIVSDVAGTTRDAVDQKFQFQGKQYLLIDTAGIRRKSKIGEAIEKYTILRSLKAIERCDVVFLLLDAQEGVTEQDKKVAGYAEEQGKAIVIVVNKWDLIQKDGKTMKAFEEEIRDELAFISYAPILFISAVTGKRIHDLFPLADKVVENARRKVDTPVLNQLLREIQMYNPPARDRGRTLKIYYGTQIRKAPPSFALFVNDEDLMHFSYRRHIENKFREALDFQGTPIRILLRNRKEKEN